MAVPDIGSQIQTTIAWDDISDSVCAEPGDANLGDLVGLAAGFLAVIFQVDRDENCVALLGFMDRLGGIDIGAWGVCAGVLSAHAEVESIMLLVFSRNVYTSEADLLLRCCEAKTGSK